ncbi:hypothetical protein ZEAMMB73_Zm00001d048034 [Zea mays]|jgi:hypothetical protein|uniref:Uncharacterized protein n=1 Tax=Zea mays TaxID=4577 RepID=A0A1D6PG30_MAIZE|nr:hypothetical protein ZEAMMB73_Zm00001d048034 [Zea mays]
MTAQMCRASYNHSMEACCLSRSYVPSAVVKKYLKHRLLERTYNLHCRITCHFSSEKLCSYCFLGINICNPSYSLHGFNGGLADLQRMGDMGLNPSDSFRSAKSGNVSSGNSMPNALGPLQGFSVSKQITPSKQPCKPSLHRASSA